MVIPKVYTLPEISFVGGATQDFIFTCYYYNDKEEYDLTGCTVVFSVIDYVNKNGTPLLSKTMTISGSNASVTLAASETVDLFGKFIYQITVTGTDGTVDIPGQGILHIANNIDKNLI